MTQLSLGKDKKNTMSTNVLSRVATPPPLLTEQELSGTKACQLEKILQDKGLTKRVKKNEKISRNFETQANGFQPMPVATISERKARSRKRKANPRETQSKQQRQESNPTDTKRTTQARAIGKKNVGDSQSYFDTVAKKEPGMDNLLVDLHEDRPETSVKLLTQKKQSGAKNHANHSKEPLHTPDNCISESREAGRERVSNVSTLRLDAGLDSSLHPLNKELGLDSSSLNNPVEGPGTETPGNKGDSNTSSTKGVFIDTGGREGHPIYSDSDSEIISRRLYTGKRSTIPDGGGDSTSRDMRSLATDSATYDSRDADNFDSASCTSIPLKIGKDRAKKSGTLGKTLSCIIVSKWGGVDISEDEDSRVSFGSESQGSLYGYEDDGFVCRG